MNVHRAAWFFDFTRRLTRELRHQQPHDSRRDDRLGVIEVPNRSRRSYALHESIRERCDGYIERSRARSNAPRRPSGPLGRGGTCRWRSGRALRCTCANFGNDRAADGRVGLIERVEHGPSGEQLLEGFTISR